MIEAEHKKYGKILILEPTDKCNKSLEFGKNREGIETILSYKAGFAQLFAAFDIMVYRDIKKNHINIKKGPGEYTSEFKEFVINYGSDFEPIESRFDILDI